MLLNPYRFSGTIPDESVQLRGFGDTIIDAGVTSINVAIPSGVQVGDLLLACVMRRSSGGSLPTGWSLVSSAGPSDTDGTSQWSDVYKKVATSLDLTGTVEFSQASAGRMAGKIIALFATTGTPVIDSSDEGVESNVVSATRVVPNLTAAGAGEYAITVLTITSATDPQSYVIDSGYTVFPPSNASNLRLMVAGKSEATTTGATVTQSNVEVSSGSTANVVLIAPPSV